MRARLQKFLTFNFMPITLATYAAAQMLKEQTVAKHQELEALMLPCLNSITQKQQYVQLLHTFYGYFKPVEDAVAPFMKDAVMPDWQLRRKAKTILLDLAALEQNKTTISLAKQLPEIETLAQAMGALYVLEGSTLGGRGITKMLLKNAAAGLTPAHLQFFGGYGSQTGAMWTTFVNLLNSFSFSEKEKAQLVEAANQTFYYFKTWIQETLVHDK